MHEWITCLNIKIFYILSHCNRELSHQNLLVPLTRADDVKCVYL